jgi:hypothetical protein
LKASKSNRGIPTSSSDIAHAVSRDEGEGGDGRGAISHATELDEKAKHAEQFEQLAELHKQDAIEAKRAFQILPAQ